MMKLITYSIANSFGINYCKTNDNFVRCIQFKLARHRVNENKFPVGSVVCQMFGTRNQYACLFNVLTSLIYGDEVHRREVTYVSTPVLIH